MKNTLEAKAKFLAHYIGKEWRNSIGKPFMLTFMDIDSLFNGAHITLLLKPLSSITDEDAINLAKIISGNNEEKIIGRAEYRVLVSIGEDELGVWFDGELLVSDDFQNPLLILECYDYLRSQGYTLPYNGLSVEEQIEYGWVKLIEE